MINKVMNEQKRHSALLKFEGWDTRRLYHWVAYADSYFELWNELCNGEVMHWDDLESYQAEKGNINIDDYEDEEEYFNVVENVDMSEEDYKALISSCDSNAYYQDIEERH